MDIEQGGSVNVHSPLSSNPSSKLKHLHQKIDSNNLKIYLQALLYITINKNTYIAYNGDHIY